MIEEHEQAKQVIAHITNQRYKKMEDKLKRARLEFNITYAMFYVSLMINVFLYFNFVR
jgi:hypothetical protein